MYLMLIIAPIELFQFLLFALPFIDSVLTRDHTHFGLGAHWGMHTLWFSHTLDFSAPGILNSCHHPGHMG